MITFLFRTILSTVGVLFVVGIFLGGVFSTPYFQLPKLEARLTEHHIRSVPMRRYAKAVDDFVRPSAEDDADRLRAVKEAEQWRACLTPAQAAIVLDAVIVTPLRDGKYKQYAGFVQRLQGPFACPTPFQGKQGVPP